MANKKFSEFELKTTTSNVSHIVGYNGAENVRITPANFISGSGGPFLPLAGGIMVGDTTHNDNVKSIYGTSPGNDLQIYHSGTDGFIANATGDLKLSATNFRILKPGLGEFIANFFSDGAVELFNNNSKKFETTNTGISVTGDGVFSDLLQARKPRSNTAGVVGLSIQPSDTTAQYGWRIDQATNSLNIDYVSGALNLVSYSTAGNATFAGNVSAQRGFFDGGTSNVIATFTSNDSTSSLQCIDSTGNVEFGANGNNFVVQPAGGLARLTVGESISTFAGNLGIGTSTITNPYGQTNFTDLNIDGTWGGIISFKLGGVEKGFIGQRSSGNADMVLGSSSGQDLLFNTDGNNERMRIDSAGKVGIGTTSPFSGAELDVFGDIVLLEKNWALRGNNANADLCIEELSGTGFSDTNVKVTIQSGGNVGVGTVSPLSFGTGSHLVTAQGDAGNNYGGFISRTTNVTGQMWATEGGANVVIGSRTDHPVLFSIFNTEKMRIDTSGNLGIGVSSPVAKLDVLVGNDERLFFTSVSSNPIISAINAVNGSYKTLQLQGTDLSFLIGGTERMRLDTSGNLLVGKSAANGAVVGAELRTNGQCVFTANGDNSLDLNRLTNDGGIALFRQANTVVGSISVTSSATAYNTSSDYRLKEDLQDFEGLDLVSKIPVYDYKWKADESRSYGVMAHELEEVLPQAVSGEKDAEEMQSVDYSKIVPLLVKSIQELKAEIELLKNK